MKRKGMAKEYLQIAGFLLLLLAQGEAKVGHRNDTPQDVVNVIDEVVQDVEPDFSSNRIAEEMNDPVAQYDDIDPDPSGRLFDAVYNIRDDGTSLGCTFKGYTPTGDITEPGKITAPKATLLGKAAIKHVLTGKISKGSQAASVALKAVASIAKKAGKIATALGVIGALAGGLSTVLKGKKPSPQDILDGTNVALKELTNEVNRKLDHMKGYVDESVLKKERELIQNQFKSLWNEWTLCIKNPSQEITIRCQRRAIDALTSKRHEYMPHANDLKTNDYKKVRKLEAYMVLFRDYANLVVMELTLLVDYYCITNKNATNAQYYCERYSDDMKAEAEYFIKYATEGIPYIKKGHRSHLPVYDNLCMKSIKCGDQKKHQTGGDGWGGASFKWRSGTCSCEMEKANIKKLCKISYSMTHEDKNGFPRHYFRKRGKFPRDDYVKAAHYYARRIMSPKAQIYQRQLNAVMEKYWQLEVLDFVPQWRNAIRIAGDMRKGKNDTRTLPQPTRSPQPELTCLFAPGDGSSSKEVQISTTLKGEACVKACVERKKTEPTINGVTVYQEDKAGCWCEYGMTSVSSSTTYKTCTLLAPTPELTCLFAPGDGISSKDVQISTTLKGEACVKACVERKKTEPTINGVTVYQEDKAGCWCEYGMTSVTWSITYKTCTLLPIPAPTPELTCYLAPGDGISRIKKKISNKLTGEACAKTCLEHRKSEPAINGATMYQDVNRGGCWCEYAMHGYAKPSNTYKTCRFMTKRGTFAPVITNHLPTTPPRTYWFAEVKSGSCKSVGTKPVSFEDCRKIAMETLKLNEWTYTENSQGQAPKGCYYSKTKTDVTYNHNMDNTAQPCSADKICLCV